MQAFYEQLSSDSKERDSYTEALAQLTQVEPEDLAQLENTITWTEWG
jgi:hypothetical protein